MKDLDIIQISTNVNRGGKKYLKKMKKADGSECDTFKLCGDINPSKCTYHGKNLEVTPYGGPSIIEGGRVPNNEGLYISKIYYSYELESYLVKLTRNIINLDSESSEQKEVVVNVEEQVEQKDDFDKRIEESVNDLFSN